MVELITYTCANAIGSYYDIKKLFVVTHFEGKKVGTSLFWYSHVGIMAKGVWIIKVTLAVITRTWIALAYLN